MVRRILLALGTAVALSACHEPYPGPVSQPPPAVAPALPALPPELAAANFNAAVARVEPVAEALCRARTRGRPCDFRFVIDGRPDAPPNAFQTLDSAGRPVVGFTAALIANARNMDEVAFVVGHETAHHILGHIPQTQESAMTGALVAGMLAAIGGADQAGIETAQNIGATVGARRFSKDFELEADALGAEIALSAGFDPLRGAAFFERLPDPGDQFLGTHPPNGQRLKVVRATVARLTGN